jgi:phenylpropionate dioxygenase-like ring-hydroxylating dioxygenase large terminal subunit
MTRATDQVALDDWYVIADAAELRAAPIARRPLDADVTLRRRDGLASAEEAGRALPVIERYGLVFTTLGAPKRELVRIEQAEETDRRFAPSAPQRRDCIAMFLQPMEAGHCRATAVMWLVDEISTHAAMLHFEQVIFLQDRIIVENQVPLLLPLDPRAEIPTRADGSSVAYRRWLKQRGLRFGTREGAA